MPAQRQTKNFWVSGAKKYQNVPCVVKMYICSYPTRPAARRQKGVGGGLSQTLPPLYPPNHTNKQNRGTMSGVGFLCVSMMCVCVMWWLLLAGNGARLGVDVPLCVLMRVIVLSMVFVACVMVAMYNGGGRVSGFVLFWNFYSVLLSLGGGGDCEKRIGYSRVGENYLYIGNWFTKSYCMTHFVH